MKKIILILLISSFFTHRPTAQTDIIPADKGGDITMTPIFHGTLVLQWKNRTVFIDPYGGVERFASFPTPDLVLITHPHGDHLNQKTLAGLDLSKAELIAPQAVVDELGDLRFRKVRVLKNEEEIRRKSIRITAVPMYNLPETPESRHQKGWGNGYVVNLGGKRFYISGDTEDIKEMRELKDIDIAFVCMNDPTMDIYQASDAVLDFKPRVVYPFHFRSRGGFSDVEKFKEIVNRGDRGIEVRLRNWYSEQ